MAAMREFAALRSFFNAEIMGGIIRCG